MAKYYNNPILFGITIVWIAPVEGGESGDCETASPICLGIENIAKFDRPLPCDVAIEVVCAKRAMRGAVRIIADSIRN